MDFTLTKDEILNGNLFKGLIKITLPLILLSIINTLYGVVDTYFVGRLGAIEVGAVSIVLPINACARAFIEGLCAAAISLISRKIGQDDNEKAKSIAVHLLVLCISLGIVIGLLMAFFSNEILAFLNVPSEMSKDAYNYLLGISIDVVFLFILSIFQAIKQAQGDSKSGVKLNSIAAILNCILDPVFIFGLGLGTFGAALATALSKAIMCPIALHELRKDDISLRALKTINFRLLKQITLIAIPSSLGYFMSSFGFVLMSKEIAAYGTNAIAGYGVGSNITAIYYIFINCWGSGLTTFVGTSLGANDVGRAKKSYRTAMVLVTIMAIIFIPLGFLTSEFLARLFIQDIPDEVLQIAINYTYYSVFTSFCMGWLQNLSGVFNGSGNTLITTILQAGRMLFIRIPLIKLLTSITSLGATNIWLAMCLSNLSMCLIGTYFFYYFKWENKKFKF